jgi:hypothetical protein
LTASALRASYQASPRIRLQLSAAYFPADETSEHSHGGMMRAYSVTVNGDVGNSHYLIGCAAHRTAGRTPKACLAESTIVRGAHTFFARVEAVDRLEQTPETTNTPDGSHAHVVSNHMMKTGEVAAGYGLLLPARLGWQPSIGARAALTAIPAYFRLRYQETRAASFTIFASLRTTGATHAH